jgi:hypothetical protein
MVGLDSAFVIGLDSTFLIGSDSTNLVGCGAMTEATGIPTTGVRSTALTGTGDSCGVTVVGSGKHVWKSIFGTQKKKKKIKKKESKHLHY